MINASARPCVREAIKEGLMEFDDVVVAFEGAFASVSKETAERYADKVHLMTDYVNRRLGERPDLDRLIGGADIGVMYDNHLNHAHYLSSVLELRSARSFTATVVWVYRTYILRGFDPGYFPVELEAWRDAVERFLVDGKTDEVRRIYDLMIEFHPFFLDAARRPGETPQIEDRYRPLVDAYTAAVLKPSVADAIAITKVNVKTVDDIKFWWRHVIEPAMYEVGRKWEEGRITVGQEHLATAITQRVMSLFYPMLLEIPRDRGRIVIAASPGELHELGPRMVADLLEAAGWDVYFLGANTPADSLVDMLRESGASALCVSTTVSFNLREVRRLVDRVRAADLPKKPLIIVGGQAYINDPDVWRTVGADAYAADVGRVPDLLSSAA